MLFQKRHQTRQVVNMGETNPAVQQQSLESLFCCLLRLEAKVFQIDPFDPASLSRNKQAAPRPAQPFAGSSGEKRSGGTDDLAHLQGRVNDQGEAIAIVVLTNPNSKTTGSLRRSRAEL